MENKQTKVCLKRLNPYSSARPYSGALRQFEPLEPASNQRPRQIIAYLEEIREDRIRLTELPISKNRLNQVVF